MTSASECGYGGLGLSTSRVYVVCSWARQLYTCKLSGKPGELLGNNPQWK